MTTERWQQIEELYHLAREQSAGELEAFLARACGEDAALRRHVESLLASSSAAETYLETPAIAIAARQTAPPSAPDHFGRYRVTRELGKGGMGAVYLGVDPAIGRTVAIKTILPGRDDTPEQAAQLRERLRREARAAGTLDHPNIVIVYDVGEEGGVSYIVMEFVEGVTLDELVGGGAGLLPAAQAMNILLGSAAALDYAHAHGVVHRDVKPANIMIRGDGLAKLADFGIAKLAAATTLTAAGDITGTPHFLAPEQIRGLEATARSDQFSLAVVAWMLLTGAKPFGGEQLAAVLSSILLQEPPSDNRLSSGVDAALRRALKKDPLRRFDSCSAFVEALQSASSGTLGLSSGLAARGRRKTWAAGAAAAALAIAAGLAVYQLRPPGRRSGQETPATGSLVKEPVGGAARPAGVPGGPPAAGFSGSRAQTSVPAGSQRRGAAQAETPPVSPRNERAPAPGAVKTHAADGLAYVWIPPGKIDIGCSAGDRECAADEVPSHAVAITSGFWMTQTETTVDAYRRFTGASGRPMPPEPSFSGRALNAGWADGGQPVIGVTWSEAKAYCEWAGLRLPTEAEWEYAARAGDFRPSYGPPDAIAWFADNGGRAPLNSTEMWRKDQAHYVDLLTQNENGPHRAGQKAANQFGLRDMLGNVWEWTGDWYAKDYYAQSPSLDPGGPPGGETRVLRGGSWYNGPRFVRASQRRPGVPESRSVYNGFRCAGKFTNGGTP